METLHEVPLRTVHAYQTDEETVLEVELPVHEPRLTVAVEGRTVTVRVPRRDDGDRWHINPEVTGA